MSSRRGLRLHVCVLDRECWRDWWRYGMPLRLHFWWGNWSGRTNFPGTLGRNPWKNAVAVKLEPRRRWSRYVEQRLAEMAQKPLEPTEPDEYPRPVVLEEARAIAWRHFAPNTPTPSVVPTMRRGVCFVWHKGGWDIEIEVDPDEGASVFALDRTTRKAWEGPLEDTADRLVQLLASLDELQKQQNPPTLAATGSAPNRSAKGLAPWPSIPSL